MLRVRMGPRRPLLWLRWLRLVVVEMVVVVLLGMLQVLVVVVVMVRRRLGPVEKAVQRRLARRRQRSGVGGGGAGGGGGGTGAGRIRRRLVGNGPSGTPTARTAFRGVAAPRRR